MKPDTDIFLRGILAAAIMSATELAILINLFPQIKPTQETYETKINPAAN